MQKLSNLTANAVQLKWVELVGTRPGEFMYDRVAGGPEMFKCDASEDQENCQTWMTVIQYARLGTRVTNSHLDLYPSPPPQMLLSN